MRFNKKGQPVTLKELENNKTSLISKKLTWKMMVKGEAMLLLDMIERDAKLQKICGSKQQKEELNQLLEIYVDIFEIPKGLPLESKCDHYIQLKDE